MTKLAASYNTPFLCKALATGAKSLVYMWPLKNVRPGDFPPSAKKAYFETELTLIGEDNTDLKIVDAVCVVGQTNTVTSTALVGMAGTIKEGVNTGDYALTITAGIVAQRQGSWEQVDFYPQNDLKTLIAMVNKPQAITVNSAYLALYGINRIVVNKIEVKQTTDSNYQVVTITATSDVDYTITGNEY